MDFELLTIPGKLEQSLPLVWTFMLLVTRFGALIMLLPGIGMGMTGVVVRTPAILVMAFSALSSSPVAVMPADAVGMLLQLLSELMFGSLIGLLPLVIINGVQMGGSIAGTTMGLQASQLIDPSFNLSLPDTARLSGDLAIVLFLLVGGQHIAVHAAAGLGGVVIPGTFFPGEITLELFMEKSADIFRLGVVLSAPVLVALMLTNFVMGLISKVVPTVNIFIISFPLTIGIGLILTMVVLPEMIQVISAEFSGYDQSILQLVEDAQQVR